MSTTPSQIAALDGLCHRMRTHVPPLGETGNGRTELLRGDAQSRFARQGPERVGRQDEKDPVW